MEVDLITRNDLRQFRDELLREIKELLQTKTSNEQGWLRSKEVRKMLNISTGTLQNLRVTGVLRYTKMGGSLYYRQDDIVKVMEANQNRI